MTARQRIDAADGPAAAATAVRGSDAQPTRRKPLYVRAFGFARHKIERLHHRIDLALLPLAASSPWLAKTYYYFFSSEFNREQHATVAGRLHHIRHEASSEVASVIIRRNVHRLEKGLCMVPARKVFALDYIDETLRAFENLLQASSAHDVSLLKYAHDVLGSYFSATEWKESAQQPRRFARLSDQARALLHAQDCTPAAPAVHAQLPTSDVTYDQLLTLAQRRASVRNFESRAVPRELIERAVAVAAQAPSACNRQPMRYVAVADGPVKTALVHLPMGTAGYADGIPVMLAVVGDLSAYPYERDRHIIYIDASLANMQLMLALETLGLASCSINWPDMEQRERKMARLLNLEPYERVVMLIAVGYPQAAGLVPHSEKKHVDEMLRWI
ncbi:nitroreductase family protein [Pseudorhodoferax soli]|uniref:Nitroreductase n=1 Tax=Pseudorhodoferax soli TaxID=545864 RepID=A0A368Y8J1_9BURK|nr:nitroreductase family protein [Pseudorhodoferax soli]RCW76039.1 nitroreductase [Pseudorhodoferax soli]